MFHQLPRIQQYKAHAVKILAQNNQKSEIKIQSFYYQNMPFCHIHFSSISSTMLISQKWNHQFLQDLISFIFSADEQTQGRGQAQNKWTSPIGNLYMTLLAKIQTQMIPYIYAITASNIANSLEYFQLNQPVNLKWVNDILIDNKKIGGILVKSDIYGSDLYVQIGIGINIQHNPIQNTTCLRKHLKNNKIDTKSIIQQLTQKLGQSIVIDLKFRSNLKSSFVQNYNQRLMYKNQYVNIYDKSLKDILKSGKFIGVNQYGFAILLNQDGTQIQVSDGRMRKKQ